MVEAMAHGSAALSRMAMVMEAMAAPVKQAFRAQGGPFPYDSSSQGPNMGGLSDLSS